jgi:saccharopine dehydrogenase-like NADP-dependent oxidoreductase
LAFEAAKEISRGESHAGEIRFIEIKTTKLLEREKNGYYTEKVRRKQLHEIEMLVDHYLGLLNSNKTQYSEMVIVTYETPKNYLSFLNKLHNVEQEVIKATLATMRKGSKKERFNWFRKVQVASKQVRVEEAESIFPER